MSNFNPRSRGGGDGLGYHVATTIVISIPAPAGGATEGYKTKKLKNLISIPAPAGGATRAALPLLEILSISIPAPAGGATA